MAAALPVAIGLFAIAASLGILRVLTALTDVSIFALNMTTALGLALAIDYSLFIVSRYREELPGRATPIAAVTPRVQTAGRTVAVLGADRRAVAVGTAGFPQYFFKSFAYAGIAVVAAAAAAAVIVLPALLILVGDRHRRGRPARPCADCSGWLRARRRRSADVLVWARVGVMKRPMSIALATTAFLLLLGLAVPGRPVRLSRRPVLPTEVASREVGDILRTDSMPCRSSAPSCCPNPWQHSPTRDLRRRPVQGARRRRGYALQQRGGVSNGLRVAPRRR